MLTFELNNWAIFIQQKNNLFFRKNCIMVAYVNYELIKLQLIYMSDIQKEEKVINKGVCFISNLPPKMQISKVRELLQPYGIERVYFKSKGSGSNRSYMEGWVEFKDKKIAKMAALSLNGTNMSNNPLINSSIKAQITFRLFVVNKIFIQFHLG
ncbi:hypothetical protein FGO68_gene17812 [Halteria grandinella]|uniref:RRM domain-containing protein n=1 Tax=Halteria grandinella TaxID=5974 RepID=A0A8J8SXS1_HALGN|nr:hypothetical protein FGO68_gene17812 [Halteria grandinella]